MRTNIGVSTHISLSNFQAAYSIETSSGCRVQVIRSITYRAIQSVIRLGLSYSSRPHDTGFYRYVA